MGDPGVDRADIRNPADDPATSSADILYSLNQILEHPSFQSSPQLTSFLVYVVNEEIAGRGALIKAYTVAVDAFGRPETFDASRDPVIRVVATRLRKALDAFYDDPAAAVPVRISIIRGSYRPIFTPFHPLPPKPDGKPRITRADAQTRRYQIIITVLLFLLMAVITYVVWDLQNHIPFANQTPGVNPGSQQLESPSSTPPSFLTPRNGQGHFVET